MESCFTATIDAIESLEVESTLSNDGTSINLSLRGAKRYFITLNEKQLETELEKISIDLDRDINELEISSDLVCQGVYTETILLKDAFMVYPNPLKDYVTIDVSQLSDKQIEISLYSAEGQLLIHEEHTTATGTITMDISSLSPGYFLLRLMGNSINKGFKLIK